MFHRHHKCSETLPRKLITFSQTLMQITGVDNISHHVISAFNIKNDFLITIPPNNNAHSLAFRAERETLEDFINFLKSKRVLYCHLVVISVQ